MSMSLQIHHHFWICWPNLSGGDPATHPKTSQPLASFCMRFMSSLEGSLGGLSFWWPEQLPKIVSSQLLNWEDRSPKNDLVAESVLRVKSVMFLGIPFLWCRQPNMFPQAILKNDTPNDTPAMIIRFNSSFPTFLPPSWAFTRPGQGLLLGNAGQGVDGYLTS